MRGVPARHTTPSSGSGSHRRTTRPGSLRFRRGRCSVVNGGIGKASFPNRRPGRSAEWTGFTENRAGTATNATGGPHPDRSPRPSRGKGSTGKTSHGKAGRTIRAPFVRKGEKTSPRIFGRNVSALVGSRRSEHAYRSAACGIRVRRGRSRERVIHTFRLTVCQSAVRFNSFSSLARKRDANNPARKGERSAPPPGNHTERTCTPSRPATRLFDRSCGGGYGNHRRRRENVTPEQFC